MHDIIPFTKNVHFTQAIKAKISQFNPSPIIIFIEPYGAALSLIKFGKEKGYNIIIFTANTDLRIVPISILNLIGLSVQIDTKHEDELFKLMSILKRMIKIDAVIPGFEYFVPIAIKLSQYLHTPCMSINNAMQLRRKDLMRLQLQQANIAIPQFHLLNSMKQLDHAMMAIGFPAICKPIDAAGSVHVKLVKNKHEAILAVNNILQSKNILWGHQLSPMVLLESYINGKEFSVEGVIQQGEVSFFSITEKFVSDQIEFIEIGHIANAPIEPFLQKKIESYVQAVIKILGANFCPFHAEIRLDPHGQPVLMEIAARLAGDRIGELINLSRDIQYFDYIYSAYFGEKKLLTPMRNDHAGIRFFYRPDIEKYTRLSGLEVTENYPVEELTFYYQANEHIPAFPKPLRRLGHVIVNHADYHTVLNALQKIDDSVVFLTH